METIKFEIILKKEGNEVLGGKNMGLLEKEADKSIEFLVSVREGEVEGKNLNNRIAAAKILIDKIYPSGEVIKTVIKTGC
ncbi:MAG: hypothetical protein IPG53_15445 [Ignavibacteriales bacterium]|nr:hypothetical protein [Ignavibacteriales bacterium]